MTTSSTTNDPRYDERDTFLREAFTPAEPVTPRVLSYVATFGGVRDRSGDRGTACEAEGERPAVGPVRRTAEPIESGNTRASAGVHGEPGRNWKYAEAEAANGVGE
jgi:hypothetical protein